MRQGERGAPREHGCRRGAPGVTGGPRRAGRGHVCRQQTALGSASGTRSCEMHITELGLVAKDEGRHGFKQGPDTATFVF